MNKKFLFPFSKLSLHRFILLFFIGVISLIPSRGFSEVQWMGLLKPGPISIQIQSAQPTAKTVFFPAVQEKKIWSKKHTIAMILTGISLTALTASIALQAIHGQKAPFFEHKIYDTRPFFIPGYAITAGCMIGTGIVFLIP